MTTGQLDLLQPQRAPGPPRSGEAQVKLHSMQFGNMDSKEVVETVLLPSRGEAQVKLTGTNTVMALDWLMPFCWSIG